MKKRYFKGKFNFDKGKFIISNENKVPCVAIYRKKKTKQKKPKTKTKIKKQTNKTSKPRI